VRVLGIDPGTAITGFSVLEKKGQGYEVITYGQITTDKKKSKNQRLLEIFQNISYLIEKYQPDEMAIEKLFFNKNITTAMSVSEARGVLIVSAMKNGLKVAEYTPLQVKQSVTGYGRASKKDVQHWIVNILNLEETPKPDDVADAIAIAICHINACG